MDLKGSRVLVTGGAGLIGSHIIDRLIREGAKEIIAFDKNLSSFAENRSPQLDYSRVKLLNGDITRPEEVKEALKAIGVDGMTVLEVRGHGRQKGHKEVYRGQEYEVDLLPKVKVEMFIADARVDEVISTLAKAARSGKIGDGKIFILPVEDAIRIRNDDRGEAAL